MAPRLLLLLALLLPLAPARPAATAQPLPPNVLLIVTDDMRADELGRMPNVGRLLVDRGTAFSRFFAPTPSCCPARATLLTGRYAHNHGVLATNGAGQGYAAFAPIEADTLATRLDAAGYRTGLFGKYLNHYGDDGRGGGDAAHVPPGWDRWIAFAGGQGYEDYALSVDGAAVRYGSDPADYSTDVLADRAERFVRRSAADRQPFFALYAPIAPHGPATPAGRHAGAFAGERAPRPPSFDEPDVSDKPAWVRDLPRLSVADEADIDARQRNRLRTLLAVDEAVGRLVAAIDEAGALGTTYVVFLSDNGYHLGEHRIAQGKRTPYDESARLPLVVRGPGVAAGRAEPALVGMHDLAPTVLGWAGLPPPPDTDGRSIAPLLADPTAPWRDALLLEGFADTAEAPPFAAVRTKDRLYVEWAGGERELYDLIADPWQTDNLAGSRPVEEAALGVRLGALAGCAGIGCHVAEGGVAP